jgi:predicted transcriptional regulator
MKLSNTAIISLKPKYAKKLFEGEKKIELRRTRTRLQTNDLVLVYVSAPVKALTGAFRVKNLIEDLPNNLWSITQDGAAITREEFDEYYAGATRGVAIFIEEVFVFSQAINLENLRRKWPTFFPPQIYRYLTQEEVSHLYKVDILQKKAIDATYQMWLF